MSKLLKSLFYVEKSETPDNNIICKFVNSAIDIKAAFKAAKRCSKAFDTSATLIVKGNSCFFIYFEKGKIESYSKDTKRIYLQKDVRDAYKCFPSDFKKFGYAYQMRGYATLTSKEITRLLNKLWAKAYPEINEFVV